ncbi:MAG: hypothetical protein OXH69_20155 [Acidobacteria bacterium]|nr:hypothetical protein [Acidobacteriota bacterium]
MTAPTEDRSGRPAAGRPTRTAREGSASSRVIAFVLLCVASLALAAGYAWWSTARRASFVQDVALPPIGSLAELDAPRGGAGPAPPTYPAPENGRAPATLPPASGTGGRAATANNAADGAVTGNSDPGPDILFRHTGLDESFGVASVARLGAAGEGRRATPLRCDRVDFAGERGVCLTTDRFYATHSIMVFDGAFDPLHRLPLHGVPSRVRLAPDGRLAAVTVFVSGHSYLDEGFSTETSVIDTYTGESRIANLEELDVRRDGAPFRAVDFNFWGVTFAADSDRFYATLATGGMTHLVEGRVSTRRVDVVVEGVECPSLSPDQTRIVFKQRVPFAFGFGWRLHVLDLLSQAVTPLAELRSVDDQAEWLDDATILYAIPDRSAPTPMVTDVWQVPADGSGAPGLLLRGASSPAVLR